MCRIDVLSEEWMSAAAQAVGAGVFFGLTVGTFYPLFAGLALGRFTVWEVWSAPRSDVIIVAALVGLIALLWAVRAFQAVWKLEDELRNWRFGLRGEQAVAEKLADRAVAAAGYVAFHDLPGEGDWNVDHVVVGPGGVFVLETKARPRRKATRPQEEQKVFFDGKVLEFPWCYDRKAAEQVERNAHWVQEFLAGFGPKDLEVQPVIVVPGWFVEPKGNFHVKVMNATYLVGYLKGMKKVFSPEHLETTIRRLDERCRVVEF
jgi:Nuclease-related domain